MDRTLTTPEAFFGFTLGADRQLAAWDRIVEYFYLLEQQSGRVRVEELGKTVEGNPFLLVIITAPANLARLEHLRRINARLADPRGVADAELRALLDEGRAVVCQSMSLHATEVGGTQMAPELAYDLAGRDDEDTRRILDNVIFLMVPCFNPDGQLMVVDWYRRYLGTEYEGSSPPWLYQRYAGHDNNRDAYTQNLPESRYMARVLFHDWHPQAYQDHHHMGPYGARLYVAPYCEPIHPHADPLIWREHAWYGAHMAYRLEEAGRSGVLNAAQYEGWGHLGFHWLTAYHNIAGMLTESASARLATPLFVHPGQLEGVGDHSLPAYAAQTNFPNPWPGGWWRLRDIVQQQKTAAWAVLDLAARHRETVLYSQYLKAKRQCQRGDESSPAAFIIPAGQHDRLTVLKLVAVLRGQGIEVEINAGELVVADRRFGSGSFVVRLGQPRYGVIRTLLERTFYPDNQWTRGPDGAPRVRDLATDTVAEFMGVEVVPVDVLPAAARLIPVPEVVRPGFRMSHRAAGYLLDGRLNDSYAVVNRLLAARLPVWRLDEELNVGGRTYPAGAFYVEGDSRRVARYARPRAVEPVALDAPPALNARPLARRALGLYQRYWGGNIDEGWTRLVLEQFGFDYTTVRDADIKAGLPGIDTLLLPSDSRRLMVGADGSGGRAPGGRRLQQYAQTVPPEYRSGLGEEGLGAIRTFVEGGGRLVAWDRAAEVVADALGLNVVNVVSGLDAKAYFTHGSTLRVEVDTTHPLGQGMPRRALVLSWNSPVFSIAELVRAERYEPVVCYPDHDLLASGWLIGEDHLRGRIVMLRVPCGAGEVVLIGCRPQFRATTHGTFKLLFNCLY